MTDQMRSADLLVTKALADPAIATKLQTDLGGTLKALSKDAIDELSRSLPDPTQPTNDRIWLVVIIAFALVMLWAAYVLGAGVNMELKKDVVYVTKGETMLTVFTTVVAFLAGLLSPSPIKK